jgi:penicillin-binding protein 2
VDFQRRERGSANVIVMGFLAVVGLTALLFLIARLGLLPPGMLGQRPPGVVVSLASTPTATPPPRGTPVPAGAPAQPTATMAPTPSGPRPSVTEPVNAWMKAWQEGRYPDMYGMLSAAAKQSITQEKFVARYQGIMEGATVNKLEISLGRVAEPDRSTSKVDVPFTAKFVTARLGDITEQNLLPIIWEENAWKIDWTAAAIFKDLSADRKVEMVNEDPKRGNVVDKNGAPLATIGKLASVGVIPGKLQNPDQVIAELSQVSGIDAGRIKEKLGRANPEWWVPVKDFPIEKKGELDARFGNKPGVLVEDKSVRSYPQGDSAAHIVGYASPLVGEDLKELSKKGYNEGDLVGRMGVESGMEQALSGERGGRLSIVDQNGETVRVIAEKQAKDGATVQLTIDIEVQKKVEAALGERLGSIVLMDPRDNSVLAMATWPRFNPNGFILGFSDEDWQRLTTDPKHPFQNRAAESAYASGSIFKPFTTAAGMERASLRGDQPYNCGGSWVVPGSRLVMGDWVKTGHGRLDLTQGLTESCDIVFYEVGMSLFRADPSALTQMAQAFGLGQRTGINGIADVAGTLPGPEWKQKNHNDGWYPGDAANFAIGQGFFEATPLQMANAYTALVRGGVRQSPLLVKRLTRPNQDPQEFSAKETNKIPLKPDTLATIREAMRRVTQTPRGTAFYAFQGYKVPTGGKTGSAENQGPQAHAWFAGFGPYDNPSVVVIAMVEGGEMGGVVAAPLGRKSFEVTLGQ